MKKLSAAIVAIFAFACYNASAQTSPAKKADTVSKGQAGSTTQSSPANPVQPASTPDWLKSDADKKKDNSTFLASPTTDSTKTGTTKSKQKRK
ncbi:hypothetical protein LJ707_05590 [Mucilaginibacter sp. UR6-1]|uniref:hypothetical protein n=1 Tax=Mucilaginibacter sp. UR6-1 TaxID=1435643 RepID=UPI001E4B37A6|nr:hypothetical protein [Mucilaginibacter sp. UR6-1]MCC8408393.1 hypothetical protein [Mucilaginibacter sp. UR6-1]